MMQGDDTIFALASAYGKAGVAVIRLSGPAAFRVVQRLCGQLPQPRRARLVSVRAPDDGTIIDRALILLMPGPGSFTGEDVAEFHLHGSPAVIRKMLAVLGSEAGCRVARAGEFTRRALMAGKLGLEQVEGLGALLEAETERQRRMALHQFDGGLAQQTSRWGDGLLNTFALVEAHIDFSDEGDVDGTALDGARLALQQISHAMAKVLAQQARARLIRDGLLVVISGPPNVGKSSLLNALAGQDIAIVSPIAGTTRDSLEVAVDCSGLKLRFIDTAGLRETHDEIEAEGVRRAYQMRDGADILLHIDSDPEQLRRIILSDETRVLKVLSKCDHGGVVPAGDVVPISILHPESIVGLLEALSRKAEMLAGDESTLMVGQRSAELIATARQAVERALARPDWVMTLELVAEDMRAAMSALDELNGYSGAESMLDRLFSAFCIGK